jgi:hypothetical protein
MKQPMQPIYRAKDGVVRFRENKIIAHLFESGKLDLNALAVMDFPADDRMQIAMQIGYSVSGFGDLSYARKSVVAEADAQAGRLKSSRRKK